VRKLLILLDVVTTLSAVVAAPLERVVVDRWLPLRPLPPFGLFRTEYTVLIVLAVPLWVGLSDQLGLHDMTDRDWSLGDLFKRVLQLHGVGFVVLATLIYATQVVVNRSLVGLFLANSMAGMYAARAFVLAWTRYRYRRGVGRERLLLIGEPAGPLLDFARAAAEAEVAPLVVGYLGPKADVDLPRLGELDDIERVLHDEPVDRVLFFRPHVRADDLQGPLLACETLGIPPLLAVDVGLPEGVVPELRMTHGRPFASLESEPRRPDMLHLKHAFDFFVAATLLLLLAPLLLLVSLAILVTMGRPVFFRQDRAGLRGRPFAMLKFRTMVRGADEMKESLREANELDGPTFKLSDDPRVTGLGRFLRRTSIDELPQLVHVLTGTMSLVGPRPLPLAEQQKIRGWHRRRLAMRPGITGLWQVSGRSDTTFERWMELDLEYVDSWSLWRDLVILLRTIPVVLFQRGAK
jgi:exopolysaccharide biosynthesis polyprenyl glycosylphosphotransferase